MAEETIKNILKEIGLTDKETEVYIFLARHGAMKGLDIAKRLKKHKAQIYSIVKNLQCKGLVEATLEFPARFTSVPLETAIDLNIKAKRDAAAIIESTKQDILNYWKTVSGQTEQASSLERFIVIDGNNKVYPKISQMVKETKSHLSLISSLSGLLRADQYGVFDLVFEHTLRSGIQCRIITEFSAQNLKTLKDFLKTIPVPLNLTVRSPDTSLRLSPRMVIRDNEEILFFISGEKEGASSESTVCLWTNCKTLVQSFIGVFEDMWQDSVDIRKKVAQVETGKITTQLLFTHNEERVKEKYDEVLAGASEEIVVLTSSRVLMELWKKGESLELAAKSGLPIRVMAPYNATICKLSQNMPNRCKIRHVPEGDLTIVAVDGRYLFEFRNSEETSTRSEPSTLFAGCVFTDNFDYVSVAESKLNELWNRAIIQPQKVVSVLNQSATQDDHFHRLFPQCAKERSLLRLIEHEEGSITEREVVNKIINAKKVIAKDPLTDINVQYGSTATTIIHPPSFFNLPDMMINVVHWNKQSSWGAEDWIEIFLWLETPRGFRFVPVAQVTDNAKGVEFRRGVWANTPCAQNIMVAKKDQVQVRVQGNTLFAGWTLKVPLYPPQYSLPPCCILFEGYGEVKPGVGKTTIPSGKTQVHEFNRFPAYVTFFHPASKYSGPGTEGFFDREHIMTAYPASAK